MSGVGKSSTANKLAAELLSKTNRVGNSNHFVPAGLLSLQGGEYSSDSSAATLGGVEEVRTNISSMTIVIMMFILSYRLRGGLD